MTKRDLAAIIQGQIGCWPQRRFNPSKTKLGAMQEAVLNPINGFSISQDPSTTTSTTNPGTVQDAAPVDPTNPFSNVQQPSRAKPGVIQDTALDPENGFSLASRPSSLDSTEEVNTEVSP
jgi:hypothetical protein